MKAGAGVAALDVISLQLCLLLNFVLCFQLVVTFGSLFSSLVLRYTFGPGFIFGPSFHLWSSIRLFHLGPSSIFTEVTSPSS